MEKEEKKNHVSISLPEVKWLECQNVGIKKEEFLLLTCDNQTCFPKCLSVSPGSHVQGGGGDDVSLVLHLGEGPPPLLQVPPQAPALLRPPA